jgi:ABC-2 type transport system ATP-binding protein
MFDVEVENLTKRFGDFVAVDSLNFPSSTASFRFARAERRGQIHFDPHVDHAGAADFRHGARESFRHRARGQRRAQSIGVIPQAMTSDLELSANGKHEHLRQALRHPARKTKKSHSATAAKKWIWTQWADKPVKMFSGGMRRRLEIARGLVHEPKFFFSTNPPPGSIPVSRVAVWEMLARLKRERDLTILVTTHYMDEADKLCDRIAIVDHGKLVALDSPLKLKASIPGKNILEVSFSTVPPNWLETLKALPEVAEVKADDNIFRISSNNGPRTTVALMEAARAANVTVTSLSVQSTTLDDVFVHYTGHQLRDNRCKRRRAADSPFMHEARTTINLCIESGPSSNATCAVSGAARCWSSFRSSCRSCSWSCSVTRSAGKFKTEIGVVDQDHGVPAIKLKEMFQAVAANAKTFDTMAYSDQTDAMRDLRNGKINGVLEIPPEFSRKVLAGAIRASRWPRTIRTSFPPSALEGSFGADAPAYNSPAVRRA